MITILVVAGVLVALFLVAFIWAACVLASRADDLAGRGEERDR